MNIINREEWITWTEKQNDAVVSFGMSEYLTDIEATKYTNNPTFKMGDDVYIVSTKVAKSLDEAQTYMKDENIVLYSVCPLESVAGTSYMIRSVSLNDIAVKSMVDEFLEAVSPTLSGGYYCGTVDGIRKQMNENNETRPIYYDKRIDDNPETVEALKVIIKKVVTDGEFIYGFKE